jgi:hypothetical protein
MFYLQATCDKILRRQFDHEFFHAVATPAGSNVLGEQRAWKAEIDVMVEDNGTVFLVYPLSDAARECLDTNMFSNTQRLGDIQFVEPRIYMTWWKPCSTAACGSYGRQVP